MSWDKRFMDLAEHVAGWSKDPSTKVGCVIVDELRRVVALGYNGFPRGVCDDHRLDDRVVKNEIVVHAEPNAILSARVPLNGCTIYTWPFPPCSRCAGLIIQAGIKRVVCPPPSDELVARWGTSLRQAEEMFRESGVGFTLL